MSDPEKNPTSDTAIEGVAATEANDVAQPDQLSINNDASGLPDKETKRLGDFA